jgi:hypothetical protein
MDIYKYLILTLGYILPSCSARNNTIEDVYFSNLVFTQTNIDKDYLSLKKFTITRTPATLSALDPLVGVKGYWSNEFVYASYYYSDDAGHIYVEPHYFSIPKPESLDSLKQYLAKNLNIVLILGEDNTDSKIYLNDNTQIKINTIYSTGRDE